MGVQAIEKVRLLFAAAAAFVHVLDFRGTRHGALRPDAAAGYGSFPAAEMKATLDTSETSR